MKFPVFLPENSDFMTSSPSKVWAARTNFLNAFFKFSKKMGKLLQKHQNFKFYPQKKSSFYPLPLLMALLVKIRLSLMMFLEFFIWGS